MGFTVHLSTKPLECCKFPLCESGYVLLREIKFYLVCLLPAKLSYLKICHHLEISLSTSVVVKTCANISFNKWSSSRIMCLALWKWDWTIYQYISSRPVWTDGDQSSKYIQIYQSSNELFLSFGNQGMKFTFSFDLPILHSIPHKLYLQRQAPSTKENMKPFILRRESTKLGMCNIYAIMQIR